MSLSCCNTHAGLKHASGRATWPFQPTLYAYLTQIWSNALAPLERPSDVGAKCLGKRADDGRGLEGWNGDRRGGAERWIKAPPAHWGRKAINLRHLRTKRCVWPLRWFRKMLLVKQGGGGGRGVQQQPFLLTNCISWQLWMDDKPLGESVSHFWLARVALGLMAEKARDGPLDRPQQPPRSTPWCLLSCNGQSKHAQDTHVLSSVHLIPLWVLGKSHSCSCTLLCLRTKRCRARTR